MAAERPATPRLRGAVAKTVERHAISADTVAEARRLYETSSITQHAIAAQLGIALSSVGWLAKKHGWLRPKAAEARRTLLGEIRRKAEREIVAAAKALAGDGDPGPAARTLASLVKTLRELARFDEEQAGAGAPGRGPRRDDEDFDGFVADPDAFREALAERLEKLRDERKA